MDKFYRFEVKDKIKLIKDLEQLAFKESDRTYHSNVIFDNEKKDVASAGGRIRLRIAGIDDKKINVQGEEKHKVDFQEAENLIEESLEEVGLEPTDGHEFYETKWYLDDTSIALDEFPFADFVEINGKEDDVEMLVKKLGMNIDKHLIDTPDDLFNEWREKKGLPFKAYMRFADYNK